MPDGAVDIPVPEKLSAFEEEILGTLGSVLQEGVFCLFLQFRVVGESSCLYKFNHYYTLV